MSPAEDTEIEAEDRNFAALQEVLCFQNSDFAYGKLDPNPVTKPISDLALFNKNIFPYI